MRLKAEEKMDGILNTKQIKKDPKQSKTEKPQATEEIQH